MTAMEATPLHRYVDLVPVPEVATDEHEFCGVGGCDGLMAFDADLGLLVCEKCNTAALPPAGDVGTRRSSS